MAVLQNKNDNQLKWHHRSGYFISKILTSCKILAGKLQAATGINAFGDDWISNRTYIYILLLVLAFYIKHLNSCN